MAEIIEPKLKKGELGAAVEAGVQELENIVDGAIKNKPFSESLMELSLIHI